MTSPVFDAVCHCQVAVKLVASNPIRPSDLLRAIPILSQTPDVYRTEVQRAQPSACDQDLLCAFGGLCYHGSWLNSSNLRPQRYTSYDVGTYRYATKTAHYTKGAGLIYCSGQIGQDENGQLVGDVSAQTVSRTYRPL